MRLIERCPNCFSSTSSDEENSDSSDKKKWKEKRKKLFLPFERYAILVFGDSKISDRDYYSKFYTSTAIQPKYFCAGKKYEIERKHKIKKRELLNDKLSNIRHYPTSANSHGDNIKGESH